MKKLIVIALTLVIILSLVAACGGNGGSGGGNNNPPPKDPETPVSEFKYKYDAALMGVVIEEFIGSTLKVRIPEKIEGESVVGIGDNAFNKSGIASVYIPNTVKNIGTKAFFGCEGLTEITIPESVTEIGSSAFSACTNLANVKVNGSARKGGLVHFGGYFWRVLDIQGSKALVISEDILFARAVHPENADITWETCELRQYLNGTWYDQTFSTTEKGRIVEGTDKLFLLSDDEATSYFSGSSSRIALNAQGTASWWWLRSPGNYSGFAAYVIFDGSVSVVGIDVLNVDGGVRPAFWLNL